MPNHVLPRSPTTTKLREALSGAFSPILVGLGSIPLTAAKVSATPPYVILLPLWTNLSGPAWGQDRHADAEWIYQVDLYGTRADQLEGMRDKVLGVVLGKTAAGWAHDLDTPAAKIIDRDLAEDDGIGEPVGSTLPSQLRFRISATPTSPE